MMQFVATFRHIDKDFGFEDLEHGSWSADFEDEESFILALNRLAIASSQHSLVDFPEVEVLAKHGRVTVRAINGQLFYTDSHSQNRKDLKVLPAEVVGLLRGQSMEEVFQTAPADEEGYVRPQTKQYRSGRHQYTSSIALILMCIVLAVCFKLIWRDISHQPRLRSAPDFVPSLSTETGVLRKYADVYVSEYREGSMLFELSREGEFTRYEMWHSEEQGGFVLVNLDSWPVQVGQHEGQTAMLAKEVYLLQPKGDEIITLHGIDYKRHHGSLSSIGEVLEKKP
ncbi:hypothetical protein SH580_17715 [Coraliomargarita algicola]|uniref:DUF4178 domain-containing protein n=1 Tax=Coraliomargarita algicola TaxID=3092156 RepID=A0ABZ0RIC1_9BACT|nr:hypothetical protein [Coraliomargarita sp. J2-16]WPJ95262.1 hypothetical protein SH580_17715 [Coraliomargarita sp. J2-16]